DGESLRQREAVAREAYRLHAAHLLRPPARHPIMHRDGHVAVDELPPQLGRQVVADPPPGERYQGGPMEPPNDHLRPRAREPEPPAQGRHLEVRLLLPHPERPRLAAPDLRAHLELRADRPEAEEPDPVLPLQEELPPLLGREVPLARVTDVRGHVGEHLGPRGGVERERCAPPWEGLERLLRHATAEWERRPRHRDPIFERDGWRCAVPACTARASLRDHHVIYRSHGGDNARDNRVAICAAH